MYCFGDIQDKEKLFRLTAIMFTATSIKFNPSEDISNKSEDVFHALILASSSSKCQRVEQNANSGYNRKKSMCIMIDSPYEIKRYGGSSTGLKLVRKYNMQSDIERYMKLNEHIYYID